MNSKQIKEYLLANQDLKYKRFQENLSPTLNPDSIIGVRVPIIRKFAKELFKEKSYQSFIEVLPHEYVEENLLHGFIIEQIKDYELCMYEIERFLPYINNWAVCDTTSPKVFGKNKTDLLKHIKTWLKSKEVYTLRYAIRMLMDFYLDDDFSSAYYSLINRVKNDDYYVKMMIAWYYATALYKQYETAIKVIEERKLEKWIHNKAIQKAIESFRVTDEHKCYLQTLRIK